MWFGCLDILWRGIVVEPWYDDMPVLGLQVGTLLPKGVILGKGDPRLGLIAPP
jgi:hypothetical protein